MYSKQQIIECLEARLRTINNYLAGNDPHSDWRYYSTECLKGKVDEIKNTLDMLYA